MTAKDLKNALLQEAVQGKLVPQIASEGNAKKPGYANRKRAELLAKLKPVLGKLTNIQTGIEANLSKHSIDKMTSAKALEKSKKNGFTLNEHFELAAKIKPLYESAVLVVAHSNLKNPDDPNIVSIKRFVSAAILQSGKKADVLITVKESIANGHKIYSIELDEINKASERFQGLSDAAEKSADRATKTPHVDNHIVAQKPENSSEESK